VEDQSQLRRLLGLGWTVLLQHLDQAVLVIDAQHNIRFVNARARRLLGYDEHEVIAGRCRLTTRGTDCESACPLAYAVANELDLVEDFVTTYRTRDDHRVPVKVTVILLRDDENNLAGAMELLQVVEADPGFYLAGSSELAQSLRHKVSQLARSSRHLLLCGAAPAVLDVARAVHRFAGFDERHFRCWHKSWDDLPLWPPGTVFVWEEDGVEAFADSPPQGSRLIVGASRAGGAASIPEPYDVLQLPPVQDRQADLPAMLAAWVRHLSPQVEVTPRALELLGQRCLELGLERLERMLTTLTASAARHRIEEKDLQEDTVCTTLVEEILGAERPLQALEECVLKETLSRCGWQMQKAAERLAISRATLWRKLREHGIERP